jgi:hypothetical protein
VGKCEGQATLVLAVLLVTQPAPGGKCAGPSTGRDETKLEASGAYAAVNGLELYYEVRGSASGGKPPLVLLHGGGSTIESTFGRILPEFAKTRQVIAVELQAHGHTEDIDRPLSFEQDADDMAALLEQLHIERADFMGFSNGSVANRLKGALSELIGFLRALYLCGFQQLQQG